MFWSSDGRYVVNMLYLQRGNGAELVWENAVGLSDRGYVVRG